MTLLAVLPEDLVRQFPGLEAKEARRLLSVIHRKGKLPQTTPTGVRRNFFFQVRDALALHTLQVIERKSSSLDPFVKYAFETHDGAVVESVRIPLEKPNRFVVCVSSQTGCSMGCTFCATARLRDGRNLKAWEIVDQVRQVRNELPPSGRVHGVVFQGMGEPLANVEEVIQAARVMTEPSLLAIDGRAITVSTAGLQKPLPKLLQALPRVRLGVSIGHADPAKRLTLMPVEASNPLHSVLDMAADHARSSHIATMLSYTLLNQVNDGLDDADAFGQLMTQYADRATIPPRVSLITYNPIGKDDPFSPSEPDRSENFRQRLSKFGMPVVRRYSGGSDVGAACGQLGMHLMGKTKT